ncbi:hypothetical protein [Aeromonas sp. sia0103]|uniref:hypothetical protein n=1 Tax=Aeromonas sp. sia0103 TaxID=2854782 RepID=UPI001C4466EE|nr:hypothetical protein [Aeromonas sp. sia0103]MBV7598948.1 hypothetical protein [Aeromonas sp. sia0103]
MTNMKVVHNFTYNGVDYEVRHYNDGARHFIAAYANGKIASYSYEADNEAAISYESSPASKNGFLQDMIDSVVKNVCSDGLEV